MRVATTALERINFELLVETREAAGREGSPSAGAAALGGLDGLVCFACVKRTLRLRERTSVESRSTVYVGLEYLQQKKPVSLARRLPGRRGEGQFKAGESA
jgi:hypothetical protein